MTIKEAMQNLEKAKENLRDVIYESKKTMTYQQIAEQMGITRQGVWNKFFDPKRNHED